jgi:hypothetical protein
MYKVWSKNLLTLSLAETEVLYLMSLSTGMINIALTVPEWNMNTEHWWNYNDRVTPKYSEKNLSQYHFVHHKAHKDWDEIKVGPSWREASSYLPKSMNGYTETEWIFQLNYILKVRCCDRKVQICSYVSSRCIYHYRYCHLSLQFLVQSFMVNI